MTDEVLSFVDAGARAQASDPTLNVALEASAGTGKTRVLVDRYLRLLEEGSPPRHILAITFTRKAAGEMKTRIIEEIRKRPALWTEIRSRLFEMHVTTIDAFCLGLLREFPLEAGLDPDVALLDEVTIDRLMEEAIDETLAASRRGRGVDVRFLVARFGEGALRQGMREFLASRLTREEILTRYVEHVVPRSVSLETALTRFAQSLASAFRGGDGVQRFLETGPETSAARGFRALRFALLRAADPERVTPADVEEVCGYFLTSRNEPRRRLSLAAPRESFSSAAAYERHREAVTALSPSVERAFRQWIREKDFYAVRQIHALYRRSAARFAELKSARAGLDFTDVLLQAVSLLEKRGEFSQSRFRLESRYHHLLIDEFQDTNEYQWRLIRALVESWGEGSGLVQEVILTEQARSGGAGRIQEPSLFLVGDRKQSIYGWRDARVEVMEKASRHLLRLRTGGGRKLTLRHSFRASPELLSFLNDLFSAVPKARSELEWSFQYRESDHFPTSRSRSAGSSVSLAPGRDLGIVSAAVADEIVRRLQEEGLRPKDIAILFRSRSSYRAYEEALVARGVPAYVYRGLGFFDSPEVMDLQALVRFLAEPASGLRAAELARSRFVGVSDSALMRMMNMSAASRRRSAESPLARWLGRGVVDVDLRLSQADLRAVERARSLFPRFLALVDRVPAFELLELILTECDYARWFVGERQAWENLKKVMEMARRAETRGYLTMSRLADFLASAATDDESRAVLEAVDAVNLMTIHAAKGLEFDSVFLVNMHQRRREDTSLPRIRELADGGIDVTALGASDADEIATQGNRVEEEEKRLLYVALTRARRRLTLSAVLPETGEPEKSSLGLLPQSFRDRFRQAGNTESAVQSIEWRGHELGILRPTPGRRFHPGAPEQGARLRLEAISLDAYESLPLEPPEGAQAHPMDIPLPPELLESGEVCRDVPFAVARGGALLRGVIQLLLVSGGTATVVERLAGPPDEEHRIQMDLRLEAVEALAPGREARGIFLFPNAPPIRVTRRAKGEGRQLPLFDGSDRS